MIALITLYQAACRSCVVYDSRRCKAFEAHSASNHVTYIPTALASRATWGAQASEHFGSPVGLSNVTDKRRAYYASFTTELDWL
jgi:hypothetical protein